MRAIIFLSFIIPTHGWFVTAPQLPSLFAPKPKAAELKRFGDSQLETQLDFTITVSDEDPAGSPSLLAVRNLRVKLTSEPGTGAMPGADGPSPHLSSGACKVDVKNPGSFVSMAGEQHLPLDADSACWEVVLREEAPAAQLLIGVDLKEAVNRNKASIPAGRLFVNIALWDPVILAEYRARLQKVNERFNAITREKDLAIEAMHETQNPIHKALKFREACQAMEKVDTLPDGWLRNGEVPMDDEAVEVNGVHLVQTGTVWMKNKAFLGPEHQLVGAATMKVL